MIGQGWQAFFIWHSDRIPAYLLQVENEELARRTLAGEKLEQILGDR